MAYEKQSWLDLTTVITAERLRHIEDGIADAETSAVAAIPEVLDSTFSLASNFDAIAPRFVTRPAIRVNNVMQSIGRSSDGHYYIAQVVGTSADLSITRCDAGGRAIDTSTLTGGGHGSSVALEEKPDGIYLWVWWNGDVDGTTGVMRRWKYTGGQTVAINAATVETMPDFGSSKPGFRWAGITINQRLDLIAINNRTTAGDNVELRKFSDYLTGTGDALATLPTLPLSENGAFQGMVTTAERCYILRGDGSGGVNAPRLDVFSWETGAPVASKDLSGLAYLGNGAGKNEADGLCAWYDDAGRLSLLFGIETGASGANVHGIYSLAPADFQNDTGAEAALQRAYSPLQWTNVPLGPGYEYRGAGYELQVAKDANGMVHLRGHMANTGLTDITASTSTPFATVPREFWPETEVRWIGFSTTRASEPWGGWIAAEDGRVFIQRDTTNASPGPTNHFCIIVQPWQAKA